MTENISQNPQSPSQSEHIRAMGIVHLVGMIFGGWGAVGVLIYWIIHKDRFQAADTITFYDIINFNLSFLIYSLVAVPFCLILIGFLALGILGLLYFIFVIISSIQFLSGGAYRFPMTIQLLK